jgi:phage-related minor tail protein
VNKLLKLDPTNTTLLAQKQELLKSAVGETKNKLTQLKSVQDQMDAGLKNGSVTQQQYDAWRREIIETEQELKNLGKEAKNPTPLSSPPSSRPGASYRKWEKKSESSVVCVGSPP